MTAMPSVHLFAFNKLIADELKKRLNSIDDQGRPFLAQPTAFAPSPYQAAIFDWVAAGTGSAMVRAVAGSGKTTTIMESLKRIRGLRLSDVRAGTFHSLGFSAVCKRLGVKMDQVGVEGSKVKRIAKKLLGENELEVYGDFCAKLVGYAKGQGIGPLEPDLPQAWFDIIQHHDLFLDHEDATEERAVEIARELLRWSNDLARMPSDRRVANSMLDADYALWSRPVVDYDDMLYLVLVWRCRLWENDWVFVDEAQDTNPVRRAIAKLALRPGGRLVAVGDERQAIYGFTGASADAMALIEREFSCRPLPLTVSYRCPRAVAERVQGVVDYFEVPATAKEGAVRSASMAEVARTFGPHDAILCRQTAPLIEAAFGLIASGVGCVVLGKDIGAGLVALIKRMRAKGVDHLLVRLEQYRQREVAKHMSKGEENKAEQVSDRVACVVTVIENLDEAERTIPKLMAKIEGMFSDANGVLTLATMHKSKGKEWGRVAILKPELVPSKWARQEWQMQQELNLQYVAWTRAMDELVDILPGAEKLKPRPKATVTMVDEHVDYGQRRDDDAEEVARG
jgi:superfamily I DNA/RNA helicase